MAHEDTVKTLFRQWDADGNGYISREELSSVLDSLGWDSDRIGQLLQVFSSNSNMGIDYSEFVSWIFESSEILPAEMVHQRTDRIPRTSLRSEANPSRSFCIPDCTVANGEKVDVFPRHVVNGMVHVTSRGGKVGWLKRSYLRAVGDDKLPPQMLHQRTDTIKETLLRSRADPDLAYCIHESVQNGEVVDVLSPRTVDNGMVRVLLQSGTEGWLRSIYLQACSGGATARGSVAAKAAIAAAEAKRQENASIIIYEQMRGRGRFYDSSGDGYRFSFVPGEFSDLTKMWVELKDAHTKRREEEDGFLAFLDEVDGTDMITEISAYSKEHVLACIQKYRDGKADEQYGGFWIDDDKVHHMLEDIKQVVQSTEEDVPGFHFEYVVCCWGADIHMGDAFLIAGRLLWLEFAVFDQ